ncbi:autotransporter-associated beta strand repeat-containing protein, partial [Cognatiyoonia sp. IB215182]|uniref:autotransporter-associated beta strand repeat-containing protein n=1 Tax=Cognatiyoonia sp. IB215182 TaxID=3097353 RepID=UPI002A15DB45|nr:hypothetical protein [Cognatiyoonia sp. IB215182]
SSLHRFIASSLHRFIASSLHRFIIRRAALLQTTALASTCFILTPGLGSSPAQAESYRVSHDAYGFRVLARPSPGTLAYSDEDALQLTTKVRDFEQAVSSVNGAMLSSDTKTLDLGTHGLTLGASHGLRGGRFTVSEGERLRLGNGISIQGGSEFVVTGAATKVEAMSFNVSSHNDQHGKLSIAEGGVVRLGGHVYPEGIGGAGQFWAGNSHGASVQAELEIDGEGSLFEITPEANDRVTFVQGSDADPAIVSTVTITVSNGGMFRINEATGNYTEYDFVQVEPNCTSACALRPIPRDVSKEEANARTYGNHHHGNLAFNIGAASGEAAVAAGYVEFASSIPLTDTSQVVFNHTNTDYEFGTAISGAGSVLVENGTTILTHENSYTGGTTITGGTLQVDDGGSIDGATTVSGGALLVNSSLQGITLNDGGVLGGDGTVSGVSVNSGATLAPGNSIGTLNVDGDITLSAGSSYAV